MNYGRGDVRIGLFFCALCLIVSGCSNRNKENKQSVSEKTSQSIVLERVIQQEAMLTNIPLPLYNERIILPAVRSNTSINSVVNASPSPLSVRPELVEGSPKDEENDEMVSLGYQSPLSIYQASDFFMNQMERYGWKHLVSFQKSESILQFKNPDYYCTIIIKPLNENSSSIFIYMKRASTAGSLIGSELE